MAKSASTKQAPAKRPAKKRATRTHAKKTVTAGASAAALSTIARTQALARARNERKGRELVRTITSKLDQIEESFYEIGLALRELRAPAVWGALGAASFEALVDSIPRLGLSAAYRFLRIVDHFDRTTAIALSQSKALALVTYVDATPEADDAETLARADAIVGDAPISAQSVRGILEAATLARPDGRRRVREGEDPARKVATSLERRLEPGTDDPVGVRLVHRKGGFRVVLDVPLEIAARLELGKKKR